jgi:hypothetical protein
MADIHKWYIDGNLANPPKDYESLTLNLNYDKDEVGQEVSFSTLNFVRENSTLINNYITQFGVFVGVPIRYEVNNSVVFDGHIYLNENPQLSAMQSQISVKEKKSIDWLNSTADSFDFEYLYRQTTFILPTDFKAIPYVIEKKIDTTALALASLTVFTISTEIAQAIEKIVELTTESTNPFEATAVIRLAIYIAYLVILLASLVKLLSDIARLLIQPTKYHAGMSIKRHFESACNYLGLTFSSSFITDEMYLLPQKFQIPSDGKGIFGFTSGVNAGWLGFYKGTFGDFLRELKNMFNAKVVIVNDVLYFERVDYVIGQPTFVLPPIDTYDDFKTYNASECKSNTLISFATDLSEEHTITDYLGTSYQIITQNNNLPANWISTINGLQEVRVGFALGKRKTELSTVEEVFNVFYQAVGGLMNGLIQVANAVISGVNAIIRAINRVLRVLATIGINLNFQFSTIAPLQATDFGNTIQNRIGMLKLSNDYFQQPKFLLLEDNLKMKASQISAKYLYENFWIVNNFADGTNQYEIFPTQKIRFKEADYLSVKNNKFVTTFDNQQAEILRLDWNMWEQTAEIEYKVNKKYDNNLINIFNEPDGN